MWNVIRADVQSRASLCDPDRELTEDKPRTRCWSAFVGYPQVVTHVYVHAAEGLENQDNPGGRGSFPRAPLSQCVDVSVFPKLDGVAGSLADL